MDKKFFFVLLFLINLNFIFSIIDCEQNENPNTAEECNVLSSKSSYPDYCCFYKLFNSNKTFCRTIPYSAIYKDLKYENINGELYEVNCSSSNEATLLEQCGKKNEGTSLE
jgi:hypothetical protein